MGVYLRENTISPPSFITLIQKRFLSKSEVIEYASRISEASSSPHSASRWVFRDPASTSFKSVAKLKPCKIFQILDIFHKLFRLGS
jgi:hypothetical protein